MPDKRLSVMRFVPLTIFLLSSFSQAQSSVISWKCNTTSSIGAKVSAVGTPIKFNDRTEYRILPFRDVLKGLEDKHNRDMLWLKVNRSGQDVETLALIREVRFNPRHHYSWSQCKVTQMDAFEAPKDPNTPLLSYEKHDIYSCYDDHSFTLNSASSRFSRISAGAWADQNVYFKGNSSDPYLDFGLCQPYYD